MRIVAIFAPALYSICPHEGDGRTAFDIAMDNWTDINWLKSFAEANGVNDVRRFVERRRDEAEQLGRLVVEIADGDGVFEQLFRPLRNDELHTPLLGKRKARLDQRGQRYRCDLRLYAVRIDENVFTITGGAIKMSQAMQDHPNTAQALRDLDVTRRYLQEHGVVDDSGFYEIVSH